MSQRTKYLIARWICRTTLIAAVAGYTALWFVNPAAAGALGIIAGCLTVLFALGWGLGWLVDTLDDGPGD